MTLAQLLIVQAHDSALDRLAHSLTTLPELTALVQADDERAHLDAERATLVEKRHEVARAQQRLEDEAAIINDRIDLENGRLYDGTITAHKDLVAIQDELVVLRERRDGLDDQVLEQMELGEPIDAEIASIDAKLADLAGRRDQIQASLAASQAAIDSEIAAEREQRAETSAEIDAELLALYETVRSGAGGVGACRLVDKTCEGCHLQLSAVDLDRVRKEPEDAIVRCSECDRILVR